ncbi:GspE/PulE family protein [Pseudidiomarina mangrovi]|uniref:GspE/PulE family protein n=1 Tax=Pseudidiomarina mangrovi TaxID=2487133 RepID=UPI000FC9C1FF|nr:ATPase, T2SS/T4P/T4SS family [Pseudidiomarina mangrovi]
MHIISPHELADLVIAEPLLESCLQYTDTGMDNDSAALVSEDGLLICSTAAWQSNSISLVNLQQLQQLRQLPVRGYLLADASDIRSRLHDADALRQRQQHNPLNLDHTRAQQALEDLVQQALQRDASDIHLLFDHEHASLAFRVHGRMVGRVARSRETLAAAIAAALNTRSDDFHELFDEQRLSSASINLSVLLDGKPQRIRLRVQKSPTRNGFAVTMRIQCEQAQIPNLSDLGLAPELVQQLQQLLCQPAGLIIVAGPTGQGKTTTLAAMNRELPSTHKIISLEDPIEIIQPHIEQKPVIADHPELNFANMVKVALREDPDVISISEIRDAGTATAAYTAALTGHLVTATIHAHDCFGVLQRLMDLGVSATALAQPGVLRAIIAQRLVALPCQVCGASGCVECQHSGVRGRQLVMEVLPATSAVADALRTDSLSTLRQQLLQQGWQALEPQLMEPVSCD